jgi:guanylate kinase
MKPIIICIAGRSGSGKSTVADFIEKEFNIPQIQSYTTRKQRDEFDVGHKFISEELMDEYYNAPDCLAKTNWDGVRYCCLGRDVKFINTYVIDEAGIDYLKKYFSDKYNITTLFINRSWKARVKSVGLERVNRDVGKFYKKKRDYDIYVKTDNKLKLVREVNRVINHLLHNRDKLYIL